MTSELKESLVLGRTRAHSLDRVKKLNFWGIGLSDVSLLKKMTNIQVLSLSVNKISTLKDFRKCVNLEELYLRENKVSTLKELVFLKPLKKLKILWLCGNPCEKEQNYRLKVIAALPSVKKIDNADVSEVEIENSKQFTNDIDDGVLKYFDENDDDVVDADDLAQKYLQRPINREKEPVQEVEEEEEEQENFVVRKEVEKRVVHEEMPRKEKVDVVMRKEKKKKKVKKKMAEKRKRPKKIKKSVEKKEPLSLPSPKIDSPFESEKYSILSNDVKPNINENSSSDDGGDSESDDETSTDERSDDENEDIVVENVSLDESDFMVELPSPPPQKYKKKKKKKKKKNNFVRSERSDDKYGIPLPIPSERERAYSEYDIKAKQSEIRSLKDEIYAQKKFIKKQRNAIDKWVDKSSVANDVILTAVLTLVKELDYKSLSILERQVKNLKQIKKKKKSN